MREADLQRLLEKGLFFQWLIYPHLYPSFLSHTCSVFQIAPSANPYQHFLSYQSYLVSDPNSSLRQGDVVRIAHGWRTSQHIKHVVTEIVAPWGPPIEERPKILSEEERMEIRLKKRAAKLERRQQRREKGKVGEAEPEGKAREGGN